jgi:hypothetical protein
MDKEARGMNNISPAVSCEETNSDETTNTQLLTVNNGARLTPILLELCMNISCWILNGLYFLS